MKKRILAVVLLVLAMCFALGGCGSKSGMDKDTEFVIESFFAQENYYDRMAYLEENYTNYQKLTTEEIEGMIQGDWLQMNIEEYTSEDWWTFEFDEGVREQRLHYFVNDGDLDKYDVDGWPSAYVVKDDVLYVSSSEELGDLSECFGYEVYKLHDNFYFLKKVSGTFYDYSSNDFIYTQLDATGKLVYDNPDWEEYDMYTLFK